jgi:hypothetical protein
MLGRRDVLKAVAASPAPLLGGPAADASLATPAGPGDDAPVESRAIVFRCGDYAEAKGFAITPAEFVAANPPGTSVPFSIEHIDGDSIFGDALTGTAFAFDLDGDEVRCTIRCRRFLAESVRENKVGFAAFFDRESRRLVAIKATVRPTIEGTGIVGPA